MEIRNWPFCAQLRSLSGVELVGDKLVRQIYADESGVAPNDEIVLVAGININPDKQFFEIAERVAELTEEYIPETFRWKKGFHAKDMFNGTGNVFGGQYSRERAHEALRHLVAIMPKFTIPVSWGCALKHKQSSVNELKSKHQSKVWHSYAFAMFAAESECLMEAFPGDVAQVYTESHLKHVSALKRTHKILQGKFGPPRNFLPELDPAVLAHLPIRRIIDCVAEQEKDDAVLLQLADACAFLLHRWVSGKTDWHTQELLRAFSAGHPELMAAIKPLPAGQTFRHGTFVFNEPTCETKSESSKSPEMDANQEALRKVEEITGSESVKGEDLVQSEELKRKFREAKDRLKDESDLTKPASE